MASAPQQKAVPPSAQQQQQQQQQAPAPQEQAKAPLPPATVALDNLQAMMNLVLISTGRFLKEQHAGGGSGRMQFTMKRTVPVAQDRFHDSLDELENELSQAQAVLRRDLAVLQADRIKREQAEAAERQRRAAESSAKKETAVRTEQPKAAIDDAATATAQKDTAEEQASKTNDEPSALDGPDDLPPPIDTSDVPPRDPLFDETPITANATDTGFDFDAEFGDLAGGDSSNDPNHDIDMDAAPDLNFLAGLEDFAKSGDGNDVVGQSGTTDLDLDFAMPDLPDMNAATTSTDQALATSKPAETSAAQDTTNTTTATTTDNFDDTSMLEPTTVDNLDDLFNMDYENPEDTQFNDAFFGYGE